MEELSSFRVGGFRDEGHLVLGRNVLVGAVDVAVWGARWGMGVTNGVAAENHGAVAAYRSSSTSRLFTASISYTRGMQSQGKACIGG